MASFLNRILIVTILPVFAFAQSQSFPKWTCSDFTLSKKEYFKNYFENACYRSMEHNVLAFFTFGVKAGCLSASNLKLKQSSFDELQAYLPGLLYQQNLNAINALYDESLFKDRLAEMKRDFPEMFKGNNLELRYLEKVRLAQRDRLLYLQFKKNKSCSSIDNRTAVIAESRNQKSIGWCYAFSAADMLSHKLNRKVSAVDVAVAYYAEGDGLFDAETESMNEGGWTNDALKNSLKHRLCEAENEEQAVQAIGDFNDNLQKIYKGTVLYSGSERCMRQIRPEFVMNMCQQSDYTDDYKPLRGITKHLEFYRSLAVGDSIREKLNEVAPKMCKPIDTSSFAEEQFQKTRIYDHADSQEMIKTIQEWDQILDRKQIFEVSYSPNVFNYSNNTNSITSHSSLIVGRRTNPATGKCEYLLRNSWGNDFKYQNRESDGHGAVWLPMDELLASTGAFTQIK